MTRTTARLEEQFVDLLCADDELLRAEFDAIVAAEWPGATPAEPGGEPADDDCAGEPTRWDSYADQALLPNQHAGARRPRRQRSPPDGTGNSVVPAARPGPRSLRLWAC